MSKATTPPTSRGRTWLFRAVALALGSALGLVGAEWIARRLPPETRGFEYHDELFTRPNEFHPDDRAINSLGFHDGEPIADRPGLRRLLLLGDSYVASLSVKREETVGSRLEAQLELGSQEPWDVIAVGRPRWGQREELAQLRVLAAPFEPLSCSSTGRC